MELAINSTGKLRYATPKQKGTCPQCKSAVLSKCGDLNVWHWAHENGEDCDTWSEPETPWHSNWKKHFPEECREVVIDNHRADIRLPNGIVIEFQNSPIKFSEILTRQFHYKKLLWVINGIEFDKNFLFTNTQTSEVLITSQPKITATKEVHSFLWNWPRKSWVAKLTTNKNHAKSLENNFSKTEYESLVKSLESPLFIDFGDEYSNQIFWVQKIYTDTKPCRGYGICFSKKQFIAHLKAHAGILPTLQEVVA